MQGRLCLCLLVMAAGYAISFSDSASMTSGAILMLIVDVLFALAAIPYLIANAMYGVRWAVSLRGHGYSVNGFSSFFLVTAPVVVTVVIGLGVARAMIPWST